MEQQATHPEAAHQPSPANLKSDGQAGSPVIRPAGPNAALKEPAPKAGEGYAQAHQCAAHLAVLDADAGVVGMPDGSAMRKSIAICGFASSTRYAIEHRSKDSAWEIWGLNQLYRHIPRADRWFDIHYNWDQEVVPGTDHRQWARECGIPFYTIARQPDVPTNVRYPLDRVLAAYEADYFTSTIPYMLALALLEIDARVRPEIVRRLQALTPEQVETVDVVAETQKAYGEYTIGIYGIDLVVGGEYFHEKPCAEFWIGAAALGRGIRMEIPPESALCKQLHRYGTDPEPNQLLKSAEIEAYNTSVVAERDETLKRLYIMEGAIQTNARWKELIDLRQRGASVR